MIVANAKLQIFGDLPKGLSPFLSTQLNFLSDTNNFKLLKTSSHDYEEYLYIFSESSFKPLKNHLDSIPDKEGQDGERSISHQIEGKVGFFLSDNRLKDGCGNIEAIKVDYQEHTLKHTFTILIECCNRI